VNACAGDAERRKFLGVHVRDMVQQVCLLGKKSGAIFAARTAAGSWHATSRLEATQGSHIHHFRAEPEKCLLTILREPSDFVVLW